MSFTIDKYGPHVLQARYKEPMRHWYSAYDEPFTLCGKGGYRGFVWHAVYSLDKKFTKYLRTYHPDRVTCPRCKKLKLAQNVHTD